MRNLFLAGLFLPLLAQAEMNIVPGAKIQVALPMVWNEETKTAADPAYVTVFAAGSIETCTFRGGQVTVKKVSGDDVYFDQASKSKNDRCAHMMLGKEKFQEWEPALVHKQAAEMFKKQTAFKAQLKADVQSVIEKGGDPCLAQDSELKNDSVYKISGRVYLYDQGTSATSLEGKSCQVELGSLVHVLGFNRASDFAVAEYYQAASSSGLVPAGPQHEPVATCKDGERIVFPLSRLKSHFDFQNASTEENMRIKGIVAVIRGNAKVCSNETGARQATTRSKTGFSSGGNSESSDFSSDTPIDAPARRAD
jgi:hypothetical protein